MFYEDLRPVETMGLFHVHFHGKDVFCSLFVAVKGADMQKNNPIIIHVPHASTFIPEEEKQYFVTPDLKHEIAVMTDHFCDDLYDIGEEMIRFPVSRLICDPERFRNDAEEIMSKNGMGAVYRKCSDGTPLKTVTEHHREEILERYYDRHHMRLTEAVERKLKAYGTCLIIDGHSFYDEPLPYELNQEKDRPDICIGTDPYHTPENLTETFCNYFREKGYTVKINRPFAGSLVPLKYYRKDPRVASVMIEINRKLYMDHDLNKTDNYRRIKRDIQTIISDISVVQK